MGVVVPLRIEIATQVIRDVAVVLQHEMHVTTGVDGATHRRGHLVEPVGFGNRMDRIEA